MSKSLFFVFYTDEDYLSDRFHILYNKVNPGGIWKFINIYKDDILREIPVNLTSIPAIYNVKKKELYEGEYVFEFVRSFDSLEYNHQQETLNNRMSNRNDADIELQQKPSKDEMEYMYNKEHNRYH